MHEKASKAGKPLVGLVADSHELAGHRMSATMDKYIQALIDGAGVVPVIVPVDCRGDTLAHLLDRLDGLCMTGSVTNIDPAHYGHDAEIEADKRDHRRDALSFELISGARDRHLPLLGICRGFQEINVALGGTLYQQVHRESGYLDHREDRDQPFAVQYGPAHPVNVAPGGILARFGVAAVCDVNSLHGQGVRTLADDLRVEARAPDGLIEAFSLPDDAGFMLAVQWHPEILTADMPLNTFIYEQFSNACRHYMKGKHQ